MARPRVTHICILTLAFVASTFTFLFLFSLTEASNYTVGLLIPMENVYYTKKGIYYASAISIAVDEINKQDNLLPGDSISFIWNNTKCEENKTIRALIYQMYEAKVSAIIGPGCTCNTSARNAAAFNVPMISYVSITFLSSFLFVHTDVNTYVLDALYT